MLEIKKKKKKNEIRFMGLIRMAKNELLSDW